MAVIVAIIGTPSPLQALHAFDDAWRFAAGCMFVAGLGCLLTGRVITEAPSLGDAARLVLRRPAAAAPPPPPPRARRAIKVDGLPKGPLAPELPSEFLAHSPLFADLEPALREQLAERARPLRLAAGEWLFHEGDPGDAMYLVRAGRLEVVKGSSDIVVRELGRGDALGELALLTSSPRSASVRAARTSDLLAIDREHFEELLRSSPALSLSLNRILGEQLRSSQAAAPSTRPRPATVALLSLDERVPIDELSRELAEALDELLDTELLGTGELDRTAADEEPARIFGPLLDNAEAAHELVVLDAGSLAGGGPWAEFCTQQADRILAFTAGGPVPESLLSRKELKVATSSSTTSLPASRRLRRGHRRSRRPSVTWSARTSAARMSRASPGG